MKENNVDSRVRRTKRLLRQGLTELLKEKSIKKITVRELSERVDINRGTFYLHYKDIYDLVDQIEQELFAEYESILSNYTIADLKTQPHKCFRICAAFSMPTAKSAPRFWATTAILTLFSICASSCGKSACAILQEFPRPITACFTIMFTPILRQVQQV